MPTPTSVPRGRFVWHELMTTDPDAAARFYATVVGWQVRPGQSDPSYRLWMMSGAPRGGLMRLPEDARRMGAPPHWMPYVAVPDVDAVVRQAQALGARVYVPPRDLPPPGGRFATLADPQGATFSVVRPGPSEPPGTDDPVLGDFSWHELGTTDWKAAWAFYQKLFGWGHHSSVEMGPGNTYWMFKRPGGTRPLGGMYKAEQGVPPHWVSYSHVSSADRAADAVARAGGRVVSGPMDVPGGDRIAVCLDPQGVLFAVHARPVAAAARAPKAKRPVARKTKQVKRAKSKAKPKGKKTKSVRAKGRRRR